MKKIVIFLLITFFTVSIFTYCIKHEVLAPPYTIYKTKGNYNDLIFIGLSKDKKMVNSFPGPNGVYVIINEDTIFKIPTILHQGYLLDNKGIPVIENAAFIDITYKEFSKLDSPLSQEEMLNMIIDDDPFTEVWKGNRGEFKSIAGHFTCPEYKAAIEKINEIIDNDELDKYFERLK
ncbi:MAG: hypothetical protein KAT68_08660 [Bacteroidales bacterium]|nr:hypothetical protein [Bacteroidales bacterium]